MKNSLLGRKILKTLMFEMVFRVCKKYFVEFENFFVLADAKSVQQKWVEPTHKTQQCVQDKKVAKTFWRMEKRERDIYIYIERERYREREKSERVERKKRVKEKEKEKRERQYTLRDISS